ncbi:GTPase IMAP family member 9 [Labeo rohita]|uniref:GTPase IMAP family member 9 n=1 Tax=Labeo rohita TaxID=84645 RepID=A0ABQ8L6V2_LABRO|nr:GTPase IMAP family member 9 [Labeo rohita]
MDKDIMQNLRLNLVLLGRTGVGKSSSGNTILGREGFTTGRSSTSVTQNIAAEIGNISRLPITVYDTPGFSDTELSKEEHQKYEEVLQKCESGLCAFLLVLEPGKFTEEDQKALEKIGELLGAKRIENAWIIFTRGDELKEEYKTMNQFFKENEYLKDLAQKFQGRYHVLENKCRRRDDQVNSLISKVFSRNLENLPRRQRIKAPHSPLSSRRIVLLGKSGVGKSAAANTILKKRVFESRVGSNSVTRESSVEHATLSGRKVSVVDTPGFFDTEMSSEHLMIEIVRSVYISSPGPHAFLIVFPVNRFTEQEEEIPRQIEMLFGEEVLQYSIILFTHGDQLEGRSIREIIEESKALRDLVDQCGGRYQVFNNRDENNREQVNDLLQKIDTMIEQNGGGYYSNEMYEDAYRFRREEEIEIAKRQTEQTIRAEMQRENNERRQQEENQRREEIERVRKETEQRIRAQMQHEINVRRQQEENQRREEIEIAKRQTEQRIRAQMQHEINERRQQEENQRREEIEKVRRQTEQRIRAQMQRENNERRQQEENQNNFDKRSGFKKFFSKYWKYFLMGIAAGAIVGGFAGGPAGAVLGGSVAGIVGGIVGGFVDLIVN